MSEDKAHPAGGEQVTAALTGSGFSHGAQLIQASPLPEGFVPPTASLAPPPAETPAAEAPAE